MTDKTQTILNERGNRYGRFDRHAEITQRLKSQMQAHKGWFRLTFDQKESLEMIAHKIGRILNGDPDYEDSWADIAGYAKLVSNRLLKENEYAEEAPQSIRGLSFDSNRDDGSSSHPVAGISPAGDTRKYESKLNPDARVHNSVYYPKLLCPPFVQLATFDRTAVVLAYELFSGETFEHSDETLFLTLFAFRFEFSPNQVKSLTVRLEKEGDFFWTPENGFIKC